MKIGILTFFSERNYGAALQAFALQHVIHELGYDSEFISYRDHFPGHTSSMSKKGKMMAYVRLGFTMLRHFSSFQKTRAALHKVDDLFVDFRNNYMKIANQTLYDKEDLEDACKCYDAFIAGSDMVWTPIGQDLDYYFLRFTEHEKRLSYAASLTGADKFSDVDKNRIVKYLSEMKAIACREQEGVDFVNENTDKTAVRTVDPTLLLTREQWIDALDLDTHTNEKYILCYAFGGVPKPVLKQLKAISKRTGMSIRYVAMSQEECAAEHALGHSGSYGPREYVELFMNASFIVTNTFHGFLFSLNTRKPFVVIHREKGNTWKSNEGRISNLLSLLGLNNRYLEWDDTITDELMQLPYEGELMKSIESLRNDSLSYLSGILSKVQENKVQTSYANKTIADVGIKRCTGCEACVNACPKACITMNPNQEGFLYPSIQTDVCISCGKCLKVCPAVKELEYRNPTIEAYAALSKDSSIEKSASGGMFITAAKHVIQDLHGVVFGVILEKGTFNCVFSKATTLEELYPMQDSKYIQARVGNTYAQVKDFLQKGITVLFTGTPCQVSGLKSYLVKDYDNLITIDLVCHGVPSPKYWNKYLNNILDIKELKSYRFRYREGRRSGNTSLQSSIELCREVLHTSTSEDAYYGPFVRCESYRMSCYYCKYANLSRCGDITMGDFDSWKQQAPDFYPMECKSIVLINTPKGQALWATLNTRFTHIAIDPVIEAKENTTLKHPSLMPSIRESIYKQLDELDWKTFTKRHTIPKTPLSLAKSLIIRMLR